MNWPGRKYLPITLVLALFFTLVWWRKLNPDPQPTETFDTPQTTVTAPSPTPSLPNGPATYQDGEYKGSVADAFYGDFQVAIKVSGGRISDISFLQYPDDNTSRRINNDAMPLLRQQALATQSAEVDVITGASLTSRAFIDSLSSALEKAS